jgi:hypothetical protein
VKIELRSRVNFGNSVYKVFIIYEYLLYWRREGFELLLERDVAQNPHKDMCTFSRIYACELGGNALVIDVILNINLNGSHQFQFFFFGTEQATLTAQNNRHFRGIFYY